MLQSILFSEAYFREYILIFLSRAQENPDYIRSKTNLIMHVNNAWPYLMKANLEFLAENRIH
jgi:hypothetical protein